MGLGELLEKIEAEERKPIDDIVDSIAFEGESAIECGNTAQEAIAACCVGFTAEETAEVLRYFEEKFKCDPFTYEREFKEEDGL